MAGPNIPTNRTTASTIAEHVTDHNLQSDIVNMFDKDATPATGDVPIWNGTVYVPSPGVFSPTGAPTDGTDATPTLDAFFAAVPDGARCYIKRGTYTIQPGADSHMIHLIKKNLEIFGDGKDATIFKVKNSAGNFISMFTNRTSGGSDIDVSGLRIHDIGFDQNTTGNPVTSIPTLTGSMFRFVLRTAGVDKANNVIVERCRFSDTESVCNIIATDVDNWTVRDNIFGGVGPGAFHDHSTIHIRGDGTRIYSNQFLGVGQAAWTAVEVHGSDVRVYDNEITAYGRVGNACGTLVPGYNQFWERNRGKKLMAGITVWAYTNMTAGDLTATQFAIQDMVIDDNQFELDYDYWSTFANTRSGVELQVGSSASLSRVKITQNTVTYLPYVTTPTSTDNNSSGILWRRGGAVVTSGPGDEDIQITDNIVTNSLASAVQFEAFCTVRGVKIHRNTGVNPGSGAPAAGSKKLIDVISPTSRGFTVSDITVDNNTAVDTRGTHLMTGVIDLVSAQLVVAGRYRDNVVRLADAGSIPLYEFPSSGDWTKPDIVPIGTTQTGNFTLTQEMSGQSIQINSASAVVVTVPSLWAGTYMELIRMGAGAVSLTASGVTVNPSSPTPRAQYSSISLLYLTTTVVLVTGDLT